MLGGPALKGHIARQQFAAFARSSRSMSSFRPQLSRFPVRHSKILGGNATWIAPVASIPTIAARFNSTSSHTWNTADVVPQPKPSTEWDLTDLDLNSVPERIGYLKDLGLDYGWGPSSTIEFLIEHIHIWTGLPWVASIAAVGLLIRISMLPAVFRSADLSAKMTNTKHILAPVRQRMIAAAQSGSHAETMQLKAQMQALNEKHGIQTWRIFVPMAMQVPLGYGCFRVVNGMAALPVPGLIMEKFAWITDFTVADPFFILPMVSSTLLYLSLKKGGESGVGDPSQQQMRKLMLYGMPILSFAFMAFFPSALQVYFITTGIFGYAQSCLINHRPFRRFMNIENPNPQNPSGPSGQNPVDTGRALRLLTAELDAERAKLAQSQNTAVHEQKISFIDRAINNIKESKDKLAKEASQKIEEIGGTGPKKNPDGTTAEAPRLSKKDLKLAEDYEKRRKEEEEWKREERNHARREAHLKALERQREQARAAYNPKMKQ
ncbi:60Kd inner membrane protein-domain-containing protein [Aspergillus cavernicola]|uniref:60Kd inner membrane protein-domain-containing protein n=1 Tax=Aspergillus cavernicola TaxID=176166 RepID=A0ABR4IDX5_9EURO